MNPAGHVLRIEHLTKSYGRQTVVRDLSLDVDAGDAVALWGANGAGKSTLIRAVLGLVDYQGRITVAGFDARDEALRAREAIGYVPQDTAFHDMPVDQLFAFYAELRGVTKARAELLLTRFELADHRHKRVSALSGGLKQRAALGLALLSDPPLLLLDEPTASLDAPVQASYLEQLRDLKDSGKAIVFATHRLEEVDQLADWVVVMEGGHLVARLTPDEWHRRLKAAVTGGRRNLCSVQV
jgi:ABC-type multidrug transport system ATPase subunit